MAPPRSSANSGHTGLQLGGRPALTHGGWAGIKAVLRERLFSLALVLALAFLLLVCSSSAPPWQGRCPVARPRAGSPEPYARIAVSLLVPTLVFALLYKYVPDAEIGWRDVWLGRAHHGRARRPGKTAIGLYPPGKCKSAHGARLPGGPPWVYYSALIMFFGAEFTHAWATRHGEVTSNRTPSPEPHPRPKVRQPPNAPGVVHRPVKSCGSTTRYGSALPCSAALQPYNLGPRGSSASSDLARAHADRRSSFAQFLAVCRRSKVGSMGTRRREEAGFDHRVGHFRPSNMVEWIPKPPVLRGVRCFYLGCRLLRWPMP